MDQHTTLLPVIALDTSLWAVIVESQEAVKTWQPEAKEPQNWLMVNQRVKIDVDGKRINEITYERKNDK